MAQNYKVESPHEKSIALKLHNITKTIEFVLFLFEYVCFGEGSDGKVLNRILGRAWPVVEHIK